MSDERIAKARGELEKGKAGYALGTLSDIKDTTRDPDTLREAQTLAAEGLSKAGRFGQRPWKSLAVKLEEKLGLLEPSAAS